MPGELTDTLILLGIFSCAAFAQPPGLAPKFEAADVHLSEPSTARSMTGGLARNGRYELRHATLTDLIRTAYGVDADKVTGGPAWLDADRFDALAKAPAGATPEAVKLMLQALLADRFQLVLHHDTKLMPAYALTAGKKPHLRQVGGLTSGAGGGCDLQNPAGPHGIFSNVAQCHNITMAAFAEWLSSTSAARDYLGSLPVSDQTGLTGAWDFTFNWFSRLSIASGAVENITLFDAIDRQLGLTLESTTAPIPVIVVDKANRQPTANPPDTDKILSLTPAPKEFEVAVVKPSAMDVPHPIQQFQPDGRVNIKATTLKSLIQLAWDIRSDDAIGDAPKWLDADAYDIVAKATVAMPATGQSVDIDSMRLMLRALIEDRFALKTHFEARPVSAYTLIALKPKLRKADPANRSGCRISPAPDGKDSKVANPAITNPTICQNVTMAQFAERLQSLAGGYPLQIPVLDATGIEGAWDFTLNFSRPLFANRGDGITLYDAIEQQLGLKLVLQKRPVQVLVIDHIDRKPKDN